MMRVCRYVRAHAPVYNGVGAAPIALARTRARPPTGAVHPPRAHPHTGACVYARTHARTRK